jgi:hypothetical protein
MLCKTINTRSVFGGKDRILETVMSDKKREHFLYRVFGEIDGFSTGKGRFKRIDKETGEATDTYWTKFSGDFRAINAEGEIYEASTSFLPAYLTDPIKGRIEHGETVTFAFDMFAIYSEPSATSYEYVARVVKQDGEESRVTAMQAAMPALPNANAGQKKIAHKDK